MSVIQNGCRGHQTLYSGCCCFFSSGVKTARDWSWPLLHCTTKVEIMWSLPPCSSIFSGHDA